MNLVRTPGCRHVVIGMIGVLLVTNSFALPEQKKKVLHKSSNDPVPTSGPQQKENRIQVVKFDPEGACVSVEGPHSKGKEDLEDPFSDCARKIYEQQLTSLGFSRGTQNNTQAAGLLKACLKQKPGSKTLLIGHGIAGRISTGNGQIEPHAGQALVAGVPESAADFTDLDTPQLILFGCGVGATPDGQPADALVNEVASKSRRVRAQNSVVFCSIEKGREGLYLDASPNLIWAHDTLDGSPRQEPIPQLKKEIVKPACICIKDQDDMCGESVNLTLNVDHANFPLDEVQLTAYTPPDELANPIASHVRRLLPNSQRLALLRVNTENLVDTIGFCSPGQPGSPDLRVTGNFTLTIHGKPRQFDVLGDVTVRDQDVMVQDHDHPEQLYWMRNGAFQEFHNSFQQQLEMLEQLNLGSSRKDRAKTPN